MTIIESLVGGFLLAILTGMLGMLLGGRKKVNLEDFEKHKESSNPHIACPVHEAQLSTIENKLNKMDEKLDKILSKS